MRRASLPASAPSGPVVPFRWLDALWIQVAGTLCDIACRHCFLSCGPHATDIPMMSLDEVRRALREGAALGMKQVYFTGGEPFLHPRLRELVDLALEAAPLTVATNGLLLDGPTVAWLAERSRTARYSLDLRVSLDGTTAAQNDPVRGRGTFDRVVAALQRLGTAGLAPVLTVVEHEAGLHGAEARARVLAFVQGLGIRHPRVKFLPLVGLGRETRRARDGGADEALADAPLAPDAEGALLCASGRCVTAQGVFTCPLRVKRPAARLGATLAESARPARLEADACRSCVLDGLRCNT